MTTRSISSPFTTHSSLPTPLPVALLGKGIKTSIPFFQQVVATDPKPRP